MTKLPSYFEMPEQRLPPRIDTETLQTYAGQYRSDAGPDVEMQVKDSQLCVVINGEGQLNLIPVEGTKFRHPFLDHVQVEFKTENDRVTGFEFKDGNKLTQYLRVNK
jgi:hypothetical protein